MDFRYSEEQQALQDTLQRLSAREYSFEQRRAFSRAEPGYSLQAWREFAALGVLALPLPEEFGGLNGSGIDVMVVMEQMGRALMLEPYLSTVVLCGGILRDAAAAALQQRLLPQIAAGETQLALETLRQGIEKANARGDWHAAAEMAGMVDGGRH